MADTFKKSMAARCGTGGLKCKCCNDTKKGGNQATLRRAVRRTQKQALKKIAR